MDFEREAIENAKDRRKQEADAEILELTGNHDFLVSEIARLEQEEHKTLTSKAKTLTANNNELATQIERKERAAIGAEDNLVTMIDQTRSAIEEADRNKAETEGKIR